MLAKVGALSSQGSKKQVMLRSTLTHCYDTVFDTVFDPMLDTRFYTMFIMFIRCLILFYDTMFDTVL